MTDDPIMTFVVGGQRPPSAAALIQEAAPGGKTPSQRLHAHCPHDCEHPQPFLHEGEEVCGCCWFKHHVRTPMIPCTPELCDG